MSKRTFAIPDYLKELPSDQLAPVELMREAAADFTAKTGDRILAEVVTINPGGANLFRHIFQLVVPSLNDYTQPLFYVWHGPSLYPANLLISGGKQDEDSQVCPSPDDLQHAMEQVFNADFARLMVRALLVQFDSQNRPVAHT